VILHFVLNDVEEDIHREGQKVEFYTDYINIYQSSDWLSTRSHLWSWGRQRLINHMRADRYIRQCVDLFSADSKGWYDCRNALREIKSVCERDSIGFCVVVFPFFYNLDGNYPFERIHTTITEYCSTQEIPVLDLRYHYQDLHGPELWVHATDQHPNEIAHDIAARAIAQFLQDTPTLLRPGSGRVESRRGPT
jgi:hypothetical protein